MTTRQRQNELDRERHSRGDSRSLPVLAGPAGAAAIRRAISVGALLLIDVTAIFLGIYVALALKLVILDQPIDSGAIWAVEQKALPLAALTLVLLFWRARLYENREKRGSSARVLSSVFLGTIIVLAVVLVGGWRFDTYYIFYASAFFIALFVLTLRASYDSITAVILDALHFERRALLVGAPELVGPVEESLQRTSSSRGVPYRVVGRQELVGGVSSPLAAGPAAGLRRALDPSNVDEVILTGSTSKSAPVLELLEECERRGIPVRLAPTTAELLTHSLRAVPAPGLPLFELHAPTLRGAAFLAKRAFDLVVGAVLLVISAPILAISALAIRLEGKGGVVYRSKRVGVNEREFDCFKLRTMEVGADSSQDDLEEHNEAAGPLFKIREDPRVTRVGAFLRRFSIDELPQLVNVLRGEMSLVGPRPLPTRDYERLSAVHKERYRVLPGMTGLWQVSGRSELSYDELVRLDFYYIESWSIWLDLTILARTIPVVLSRRGAY
jgi:exopolysaccharide biosynthesis polyprenyl glycosylphosphotransferase